MVRSPVEAATEERMMRGRVLVENEGGGRSLYMPEAHIQIYVYLNGAQKWIVAAFRTDGYYAPTRETAVPTTEHLRRDYRSVAELDAPQHLVDYAVESERRRQEEVGGIAAILEKAVETKDLRSGWKAFQAHTMPTADEMDFSEEAEHRIGAELNALIASAGGLQ